VILDASHNPEGAEMLEANLRRLAAATGRKPVIVIGVLGEFRARALLAVVTRHAREIHVATPRQARATSYAEIVALTPPAFRPLLRESSVAAIFPDERTCTPGAPGDTVVITGSIYLLGEMLERLEPRRGAGEGRLQDF
jgi:dihydrofolate synthase/folylpolyglutamate synthase